LTVLAQALEGGEYVKTLERCVDEMRDLGDTIDRRRALHRCGSAREIDVANR
jgi:hypothetical protein